MPSDTPSRCEPPEEWREVEGWHFLKSRDGKLFPYEWVPRLGGYWSKLDTSSLRAHDFGFTYHSPALPDAAAEIERLKAENEHLKNVLERISLSAPGDRDEVTVSFAAIYKRGWFDAAARARAALARERTA